MNRNHLTLWFWHNQWSAVFPALVLVAHHCPPWLPYKHTLFPCRSYWWGLFCVAIGTQQPSWSSGATFGLSRRQKSQRLHCSQQVGRVLSSRIFLLAFWVNNTHYCGVNLCFFFFVCFFAGPALCQMLCHHWPAQGCLSLKWMSGRSRQLSKRNRLDSKHSRSENKSFWTCNEVFLFNAVVRFCFRFCFLNLIKEQRLKELSKRPSFSTTDTSPISTTGGTISTAPAIDLFSTPSCSNGYW